MTDQTQNAASNNHKNIHGVSDNYILKMIEKGDPAGLELIYDKYASKIYGVVLDIVPDRTIADEILMEIFLRLKDSALYLSTRETLWIALLMHSYFIANSYIIKNGLSSQKAKNARYEIYPLLQLLFYECLSLKEAAHKLGIAESAAQKGIHNEFSLLFASLKEANVV